MSDFLPRDVLIDVLTRLPIKTLVRCACVCKSWYSLLTNPSFITTHLNRSSLANNNHHLLLIRRRFRDGDEGCCRSPKVRRRYSDGSQEHYSLLRCENEMFFDYAEFELPLNSYPNDYFSIIGSCDGLVCLSDDLSSCLHIHLWNPSIQKTLELPPLRVTFQSHGAFIQSIGFGFDSLTNDYKVIRVVYLFDGAIGYETPPEVDIFSLSTGTWRNISHLGLPHIIFDRAPQAYLNGAAHWLAHSWRNQRRNKRGFFNLIVSFHMGDEVFSEIMMPGSIVHDQFRGDEARVAKFQESLSLVVGGWGRPCCIWVMKEYGILDSWAKLFKISTDVGLFESLAGFTRKGEVLFGTEAGYLVAYDPEAERTSHLHIRGSKDSWDRESFYADGYTESLVLLGAKFPDTVTCEESPVLDGEASSTKKKNERKSKIKEEREDRAVIRVENGDEKAREGEGLLKEVEVA